MALPHPSLTLILDIDETLDTEQTRLEVGRCYTHVATALVRPHAAEAVPENTMRMLVKLGNRRYLGRDESCEALWSNVMERWLFNQFHTVSNNMAIYNRRQSEIGASPLEFDWMEIELENGALAVRLHLDSVCQVKPEASEMVSRMRAAFVDGVLGQDVVRISAPSAASYKAQCEQDRIRKADEKRQRALRESEREQADLKAREEAERRTQEEFLESPSLVERRYGKSGAPASDVDDAYALDESGFVVDYRMWTVEYGDGSVRDFDSDSMTFAR